MNETETPSMPDTPPWRDSTRSTNERVEALLSELTLEEKCAQLYGVWIAASAEGGEVAPHQHDMSDAVDLDALLSRGLGQLTRPFGTQPVDPAMGALSLARTQRRIVAESRLGIPAVAHDECLAGFAAWGATAYPVPLAWGATFSPELIERVGARIGADMRSVGVHQGLSPVLDVVRDARWGRIEETIGEDPYLVGTIASSYIRGLEGAGVVATLKHFVGYSASRAGRNLAPVSVGPRELADVLLPPFEMAIRESGVRSVMNSYSDIDGVPSAGDEYLLTTLLRDTWGFTGTVVADYFAVGFLHRLHGTAADWAEAAGQALRAGIDVELPTVTAYGDELIAAVREGRVEENLVDRALRRVLAQKIELGLLDTDYDPTPEALRGHDIDSVDAETLRGSVSFDTAGNRELARDIAERSIVLLTNNGTLPFMNPRRIAVIGPNADDPYAVLGCYSFPAHVGVKHPNLPIGIDLPTLRDSVRMEFPDAEVVHASGTSVSGGETEGIAAAAELARSADVVVLALGDRAGLFGRGTSGEGCDAENLALPGAQQMLVDAILDTGTPTSLVLLAGRPYFLGSAPQRAGAIVAAFFAGEEGTGAIAGVLSGRVNPSGRLPVSVPAHAGAQPSTYLAAPLGQRSGVSNIDPTPAFWFGHGLGYSSFAWTEAQISSAEFSNEVEVAVTVTNTGKRSGSDVVQVYLSDPVASVVRPVRRLIAYHRLELNAGASARVRFLLSADLTSFTARDGRRIVEPGEMVFGCGRSAGAMEAELSAVLTGEARVVDHRRALHASVCVEEVPIRVM
ncbi:beta-glucosidase-like glycosyl hydrolase [Klugiella xanthotipulae]|uniref:Beta-glucosidase-like glycosyl hydrolase n=2 Tax=Klugiella xanthotipulae TaxID=244735 RepID=A0A543I3S8_9MICO|nr:beta-glucosidase-like glycosyl hydrolase [Klugiella xanthotipulae]